MSEVKEKAKESEDIKTMTSRNSRILVETRLEEIPGLKRQIHYLHDHNYRVNYWDLVTSKIVKSHYVTVHPDKSLTIHDD